MVLENICMVHIINYVVKIQCLNVKCSYNGYLVYDVGSFQNVYDTIKLQLTGGVTRINKIKHS